GLNLSIIQNERGEEQAFLDTAWTLQIIRGVVLFCGACVLAWPLAVVYDTPMLLPLLLVASLSVFFSGFQSTRIFTLNRRLMLGWITALDLSQQSCTLIVTVLLAWYYESVWALVGGAIFGAVFGAVVSNLVLARPWHRLRMEREALRELLGFGTWIFVATAV